WKPTAQYVLRSAIAQYKTKMNLDAGQYPGPTNEAFMCRGKKEECIPSVWLAAGRTVAGTAPCLANPASWWAKVVSINGDRFYRCVPRYQPPAMSIPGPMGTTIPYTPTYPGAVRWAWFDKDEESWWRCLFGCCFPS